MIAQWAVFGGMVRMEKVNFLIKCKKCEKWTESKAGVNSSGKLECICLECHTHYDPAEVESKYTPEGKKRVRNFLIALITFGIVILVLAWVLIPEKPSSCPLQGEFAWDSTQNWDGTWDVLVKGEVWNTGDWEGVDLSGLEYRKGTVRVTITDTMGQKWIGWINFRVYDTEGQNPKTIQKWFRGFEYEPVKCQGRVMCGWHE